MVRATGRRDWGLLGESIGRGRGSLSVGRSLTGTPQDRGRAQASNGGRLICSWIIRLVARRRGRVGSIGRRGVVYRIITQVRLGLGLRQAVLLGVVGRLSRGARRLVSVCVTRQCYRLRARGRHARCIGRIGQEPRISIVIVPPVCDVVPPLSDTAWIPTALHRVPRVSIGRPHILYARGVEHLRVISGVETWHASR